MATARTDVLDTPQAGPTALRGSALRTGGYVAGILLSLISAPLLVRHLGVADFGRYVTVTSLISIVTGFTEGGLNAIVLREFATLDDSARRQMMRSAIGIRIVLTVTGVALATAFALAAGYEPAMVIGTVLAGTGLVIQLMQSLFSVTLQSRLRFGWVTATDLIRQAVSVALIVALVLAGAGLVPLLAVAIPAAAVSLAVTIPLVWRATPLTPTFHLDHWWRLLRETIPWAVIGAVNIVYLRLAIVLMSLIASAVQTGYFATSFRITEILVGIPGLVISAAFPILARAERDDRSRFVRTSERLFELSLVAAAWLVVCLEVGAAFAIHLLAANKADPAILVLRIQGLSLVGNFIAVACGFPLLTLRRYRPVLAANLLALAISGVLTLALVPSLGARGAAIAAVVAETGLAVASALILHRALPQVKLSLRAIPIVAIAGALAVAAGLLAPIHPILGVILASAVFLALLALCGRLPPELRELLDGFRRAAFR